MFPYLFGRVSQLNIICFFFFYDEYVKGEHVRHAQDAPFARFSSVWPSYTLFKLFCISHYYKFNLGFLSSLYACLVLHLI